MNKAEVKAIVRAELRSLLGEFLGLAGGDRDIEYAKAKEAARQLGYNSEQSLYKLVKKGVLREGKEFQDRRSSEAVNACYYFNIPACRKRLDKSAEKRKA